MTTWRHLVGHICVVLGEPEGLAALGLGVLTMTIGLVGVGKICQDLRKHT